MATITSRAVAFLLACLALSAVCMYAEHVDRVERARQARHRARQKAHANAVLHAFYERQRRTQAAPTQERRRAILHRLDTLADASMAWSDWMDVADMYAAGSFPDFAPRLPVAAALYHAISVGCPDRAIANHARALVAQPPAKDAADVAGEPLPAGPGTRLLTHISSISSRRPPPPPVAPPPPPAPTPKATAVRNDPQNAHDHAVVASLKTLIDRLPEASGSSSAREEVERALFGERPLDMTDEDKAKALAVLQSLREDQRHSGFGVTEVEALGRVVARIESLPDATKQNAIETLGKQLAAAHERGTIVCSTGKIARIVGALDGVTENAELKPVWAVREELGSLASMVRASVLDAASPTDATAYAQGEAPHLEEAMREKFTSEAINTYCTKLGMSTKVVHALTEQYSAAF